MRITKNQLRQIIKEELGRVLREDDTAQAPELDVDHDPSKGGHFGPAGPRGLKTRATELPAGSGAEQKGKAGRGEGGTKADQPSIETMEAEAAAKERRRAVTMLTRPGQRKLLTKEKYAELTAAYPDIKHKPITKFARPPLQASDSESLVKESRRRRKVRKTRRK